jgi:hypothetical protein
VRSPNQRRSGSIRVLGSSLDWNSFLITLPPRSLLGRVLYIWRRRTVPADRTPPPAPPPAPFLSLARLTSSECRGLPDTFTGFSFLFPILSPALSVLLQVLVRMSSRERRRGEAGKGRRRRDRGGNEMVELGFCLPKGCSHAGLRGLSSAGEGCSADVQRNGQVPYRSGGLSMLLCCWRYQSARAILWVHLTRLGKVSD